MSATTHPPQHAGKIDTDKLVGPDALDLERSFIGVFLYPHMPLDGIRLCIANSGLRKEHFSDKRLAEQFVFVSTYEDPVQSGIDNTAPLVKAFVKRFSNEELLQAVKLASEYKDAETLGGRIKQFLDAYTSDKIGKDFGDALKQITERNLSPQESLDAIKDVLSKYDPIVSSLAKEKPKLLTTSGEFDIQYNKLEHERQRLFANRQHQWLPRGGISFIVSPTGTGKSVLVTQMAHLWAAGRPAFGITPARPLKIGYYQTEDSDFTIRNNNFSLEVMFTKKLGWTLDEWNAAHNNVVLISAKPSAYSQRHAPFKDKLLRAQREGKFDIIIINPFQAVTTDIDLKDNAKLGAFLRDELSPIANGDCAGCEPFGLLIVHHTNKPFSKRNGSSSFAEIDNPEYLGAGGAEIANIARSITCLMPIEGSFHKRTAKPNHFRLILAKPKINLGWLAPDKFCPKPYIVLRHHDEFADGSFADIAPEITTLPIDDAFLAFWHQVDSFDDAFDNAFGTSNGSAYDAVKAADAAAAKPKYDSAEDARTLADEIKKQLPANPATLTAARNLAIAILKSRIRGNKAYDYLKDNLNQFGLKLESPKFSNASLFMLLE